jgi:ribulose-phosphate 3-epimerase
MIKIAPSILSADFANFDSEIKSVSNADLMHTDVMDNHFVPNLTFGAPVVKRLAEVSPVPLDIHLMIEDPDIWAPKYVFPNVDSVTFHTSASKAPIRLARKLRSLGVKASIAVLPSESVEPLFDILDEFDMVLIMTVEPGFGGQKFLANQFSKIEKVRKQANSMEIALDIEIDGGVSRGNIARLRDAGANVFVAGSAILGTDNPAQEVELLRSIARG